MARQSKATDNARFWIWYLNSWVKLCLAPNQTVEFSCGGATEEGYSSTADVYTHEGDVVRSEYHNYSSDCDGPHEYHSESVCPLGQLKAVDAFEYFNSAENVGIYCPEWVRESAYQRDTYAEMAGY